VAIRLGLWTWTSRADEGWFGVPWGNFFAWLFVAFWFSFFTRQARAAQSTQNGARARKRSGRLQWLVPFAAFGGLIAVLVPFVALENAAALPFVPDEGGSYRNSVWVLFALTLALFVGVTVRALAQELAPRKPADHWLLLIRLTIHALFLLALVATGMYLEVPLLLAAAIGLFLLELFLTRKWLLELRLTTRRVLFRRAAGARGK
jgi:hypothetical protein